MTVAVVIPVYNTKKYLRECIDSVLAQTHTDLEVILVDDGSTDGSADICDAYAAIDKRVKVIHTTNGGQSRARNMAVKVCTANYITFVDSDDIIHTDMIATMVAMLTDEHAAAAMCDFTTSQRKPLSTKGKTCVIDIITAIKLTLYQHRLNPALWGKLLPTKAVLQAPLVEQLWYEDLDAFYRIYEAIDGDIAVTTAKMYYYRQHPGSFIHTFDKKRLDALTVTEKIENHYKTHPLLSAAARDRRFSANYNMFALCSKHKMHNIADECWQLIRQRRCEELISANVRLKNRLGALLAFLGKKPMQFISGILTR